METHAKKYLTLYKDKMWTQGCVCMYPWEIIASRFNSEIKRILICSA